MFSFDAYVKTGDLGNCMMLMILIASLCASIITGVIAKRAEKREE